uniref:Peptidase A1 domain-containing protein n=1 Tax=Pseudo-nitzschia australis TaxID=44445 RepID=A0A7S4AET9_9STRA
MKMTATATATARRTTSNHRHRKGEKQKQCHGKHSVATNSGGARSYSLRRPCRCWWWIGTLLLRSLLLPTIIVADDANNSNNNSSNSSNNSNNNNYGNNKQNRKLVEQGLRGGNGGILKESWISSGDSSDPVAGAAGAADDSMSSLSLSSNITIPLHARSGTWHVYLYIGSPPQRQTLIVDTGSKSMAFPCKTCNRDSCGECCGTHASPYFDPSLSTTHRVPRCGECLLEGISKCPLYSFGFELEEQEDSSSSLEAGNFCSFSQKYTEGSSWKATEVEDMVWLGSENVVESIETFLPELAIAYPFGCQTSTKGLFRKQYADGILGLSSHDTSIVTALYKEGLIPRNAFSLCFTPEGGAMSLGGTLDSKNYHLRPMVTTPVTRQHEHGYYSVDVIRLLVGKHGGNANQETRTTIVTDSDTRPKLLRDMNSGRGCILDSGTTDSYFPASLAKAMRKAVIDYGYSARSSTTTSSDTAEDFDLFSNKWRHRQYTHAHFQALLPVVTLVLANNAVVDILPQHYMEGVPIDPKTGEMVPWEGSREFTNRLYFDEQEGSVLGANAFFGYDLLFDSTLPDRHRIGIAPADCHAAGEESSSTSSVSSTAAAE